MNQYIYSRDKAESHNLHSQSFTPLCSNSREKSRLLIFVLKIFYYSISGIIVNVQRKTFLTQGGCSNYEKAFRTVFLYDIYDRFSIRESLREFRGYSCHWKTTRCPQSQMMESFVFRKKVSSLFQSPVAIESLIERKNLWKMAVE